MTLFRRSKADFRISAAVIFSVLVLDRLSKLFFLSSYSLGESHGIIPNIFHFTLVFNTGIAFGMFKDAGWVFILVPIIAVVLLVYNMLLLKKQGQLNCLYLYGLSLIVGGALGNLFDRMYYGYVIDFLDFRVWPVFNIADSAITVGAALVIIQSIRAEKTANDKTNHKS